MSDHINVIGAGLAGCEAAWQAARRGVRVVLYEMKPKKMTPAHRYDGFAELVCSNSFKSTNPDSAAGTLKYELALQNAFSEARSAYSAYTQEYHRYQSLQGAVKAAQDAVNISQDLYKNGLKDFNNVLDAQRSLLTLEEALTISRGKITTDLIALYKALGGGIAL